MAQGLIQRWKESARIKGRIDGRKGGQREKPEGAPAAKESPAPTGRRDTPGGAAGRGRPNRVGEKQRNEEDEENGRGAEREKELAEESKQRSFEDGFKCDSWHALYWVSEKRVFVRVLEMKGSDRARFLGDVDCVGGVPA